MILPILIVIFLLYFTLYLAVTSGPMDMMEAQKRLDKKKKEIDDNLTNALRQNINPQLDKQ